MSSWQLLVGLALLQLVLGFPSSAYRDLGESLGEGFAGVVSTRNFKGEGYTLEQIDQKLAARDHPNRVERVQASEEYTDGHGHAVHAEKKDIALSELEDKLSATPSRIMKDEGGDSDGHEDDNDEDASRASHSQSQSKILSTEGGDADDHEDDKTQVEDESCNSPGKQCDPEHCLCKHTVHKAAAVPEINPSATELQPPVLERTSKVYTSAGQIIETVPVSSVLSRIHNAGAKFAKLESNDKPEIGTGHKQPSSGESVSGILQRIQDAEAAMPK